jgi:hypothetical protein
MIVIQWDLFQPPEPPPLQGSIELNFDLILKDDCKVSVYFERRYLRDASHIEFYGAISETGYRSHFDSKLINEPDGMVIKKTKEIAEFFRDELLKNDAKKTRKKRRVKG